MSGLTNSSRNKDIERDKYYQDKSNDYRRIDDPRDKERVQNNGKDRDLSKEPRDREKDRERTRRGDNARSRSRERRRRDSRSRSRSRGRSNKKSSKRSRSRSRSNSEDDWEKLKAKRAAKKAEEEKKSKKWDVPPEGETLPPAVPGVLQITPQLIQATMVAANPQQTRQARRLYVGNIPAGLTEIQIAQFFDHHLKITGKCHSIPPVSNVQIHADKAFAFLEFVRVEDATLCMLLDGIVFENQKVKIRRPKDYQPIPGLPSNPEELAGDVVLPGVVSTTVRDTPFKVYLGNLPTHLTDAQVQTLVTAFGQLRSFHLVTEVGSSSSKGYCFFEYVDNSTAAAAVKGLHGLQLGEKALTCSFANAERAALALSGAIPGSVSDNPLLGALASSGLSTALATAAPLPVPTKVLRLGNMVSEAELVDDAEYSDILLDVKEEMCNYGPVVDVKIPRPDSGESGVGFVFINFSAPEDALAAYKAMTGRQFAGKPVLPSFYDEDRYSSNDLS